MLTVKISTHDCSQNESEFCRVAKALDMHSGTVGKVVLLDALQEKEKDSNQDSCPVEVGSQFGCFFPVFGLCVCSASLGMLGKKQ